MDRHDNRPTGRRLLLIAAVFVIGAVLAAVAVTLVRGRPSAPSAEQSAQQRCETDVKKRLFAPENATISDLKTEAGTLDPEALDFSSLTASEPLKDVDRSRISVLNVSGVVNAPSEVGSMIRDHFDCRAYFVDGSLAHTLVVFDHGH